MEARVGVVYEDVKPSSEWKEEDDGSNCLIIYVPGFKKEELRVSTEGTRYIRVRGERPALGNRRIRFLEDFEVPANSDLKSVRAKFLGGTLYITIPLIKHRGESTTTTTTTSAGIRFNRKDSAVDPDSGSSSLCSACTLPVFSTPSVSVGEGLFLHEQCARSPTELQHQLHPDHTLVLVRLPTTSTATCHNCRQLCGTMFYQCPFMECDFQLDLLCARHINILHRSHHHTMTAVRIRDSASLTCNACDTRHIPDTDTVSPLTFSYLCNLCGFWVHPDCASLPNPIIHFQHHQHSLFLTYNLPISAHSKCFICSDIPKESSGVYFCLNCPNYLVHIRCALTHPDKFNPVFIRDALVTDLARLPLADDRKSLIPYITQRQVDDDDDDHHHHQKDLHPHPLLVVDEDDNGDDRVCNACVELISAPDPFVTCSKCPDFFLHSCCGRLPVTIQHRAHQQHPLHLSPKAPLSGSEGFSCKGCSLRCNGFAYSCNTCHDFTMDVVCALLNPAITHQSHDSTHILFMSSRTHFSSDQTCNCCSSVLSGICYECSICRNFKLHLRCALLPETVRHVLHEEHPLQLTKKPEIIDEWCEICEEHLGEGRWFYCCADCNQSFHVDCVPAVDGLSKIKLGSLVRVVGHGCPLELVRSDDGDCAGRRCGFCRQIINFSGGLAYHCRNCFFCTHHHCAQKYLVNT